MPLDVTKGSITLDFAEKVAAGALAEDIVGEAPSALVTDSSGGYFELVSIGAGADVDIATKTQDYDVNSLAVAVGFLSGSAAEANHNKLRLYMDGELEASSGYYAAGSETTEIVMATKALSGNKICKIAVHDDLDGGIVYCATKNNGGEIPAGIGIGSIKLV